MLRSLTVEGYALVDHLRLDLAEGMNVLTGETGAGKSVLVGALQLVLGGRADLTAVEETERTRVSAEFRIPADGPVAQVLREMDLDEGDGALVVQRTLTRASGSSCRINGSAATVAMLKRLGDLLVDFHGQHEHQELLRPARHLDFLDALGPAELRATRAEFAHRWAERRELLARRAALTLSDRESRRREALLRSQIGEIDSATLEIGEDARLLAERRLLQNAENLAADAALATASLSSDDEPGGAREQLAHALRAVERIARVDETLGSALTELQAALVTCEEWARQLADYVEERERSPERLEELEGRLALIRDLERKYGDTIEEILEYREEAGRELASLENAEAELRELSARISEAEAAIAATAKRLGEMRAKSGERLCREASRRLEKLGMAGAQLSLEHAVAGTVEEMNSSGADRIQFLVATAPERSPQPLARIASGGEISRTMLALRSLSALEDAVPTVVFDEIDAGIGGRTSAVVGRELLALTTGERGCQVICVTHSASIAALAHRQIAVRKETAGGKTRVIAETVAGAEREGELARMLGGDPEQSAVAEHVRALAREAEAAREQAG